MDDLWQMKCCPAWTPPGSMSPARPSVAPLLAPPPPMVAAPHALPPASGDQMDVNRHHKFYPFTSREGNVENRSFIQEPTDFSSLNSVSSASSKTDMGNSFRALLSWPPSPMPYVYPHLPKSEASLSISKLPAYNVGSVAGDMDCSILAPYLTAPSDYHGYDIMGNDIESSSQRPSSLTACSYPLSMCNDLQGFGSQFPSFSAGKPIRLQAHQDSQRGFAVSSSNSRNGIQLQTLNVFSTQTKEMDPKTSISCHASSFIRGCPRVFCQGKVGELFVSDNGLLGVYCLCHSLRMSVAKFCEHSGSYAVNPGDAVTLENGETVAQWRRLFFLNLGVRVPDDASGWDWANGVNTSGCLVRSKANTFPNSKNTATFQLQEPFDEVRRPDGQSNGHRSYYPHEESSVWEKFPGSFENTKHRDSREDAHKNFTGSTHGVSSGLANEHMLKEAKESGQFLSRSILSSTSTTGKQNRRNKLISNSASVIAGNASTLCPNGDPVKSFGGDFNENGTSNPRSYHFVDRDSTPSSIELRLGQPSQQNHCFTMSATLSPQQSLGEPGPQTQPIHSITQGCKLNITLFLSHLVYLKSRVLQKSIQKVSCMPPEFSTSSGAILHHTRGYADTAHVPEQEIVKSGVDCNPVIPFLLSHFSTSEEKLKSQTMDNINCKSENFRPNPVDFNPLSAKCSIINFSRNVSSEPEIKSNMKIPEISNQMERGKELRVSPEDRFYITKPWTTAQSKLMKDHRVSDESSDVTSYDSASLYDRQNNGYFCRSVTRVPGDPEPGHPSELGQASFGANTDDNQDDIVLWYKSARAASLSTSPKRSLFSSNTAYASTPLSSLSNKINIDTVQHSSGDKTRLSMMKHAVDLPKQASLPASREMNSQQVLLCPSTMGIMRNTAKGELAASEDFRHGPNLGTKQGTSRVAFRSLHSCCKCSSRDVAESLCGRTGNNRICHQTGCIQDVSLYSSETHVKSPICHVYNNEEQSISRLYKTDIKITDWAEDRTPSQKEGSSIRSKCLKGRHVFKRGSLSNSFKEFNVCGKGHRLLTPAYDINHLTQDGKRIALDQCDGSRPVVNDDCQSPHGTDVRCNGIVDSDVITTTPHPAKVFPTAGSINNQHTCSVDKDFDLNGCEAVSSKEQKLSNGYSRCSAHVVTDVSVEDNNLDSSTSGTGDARSQLGLVFDEGSVVEKCGSSDDVLENTKWNFSVMVKSNVEHLRGSKYGSYNSVRNPTYVNAHHLTDFRDKVDIREKPMPRKKRNQSHSECTRVNSRWAMKESNKHAEPDRKNCKADRKKKATKWKRLDDSFPASGPVNQVSASSDIYLELKSPSEGKELPAHLRNVSPRIRSKSNKTSGFKHNSSALPADFSTKAFDRKHITCIGVQMEPEGSGSSNGTSKSSAGRKRKRNFAPDDKEEINAQDSSPEQTALPKYKPFGRKACSIDGMCRQDRLLRPVVRGNSGIICNGNMPGKSKPVKIVSLTSVLKIAKRCTINQNAKENASSIGVENAECFSLKVESHELSVAGRGRDTGDVEIFGSKFNVKVKPRSKETRKRKLSEITGYSNDEGYTSCQCHQRKKKKRPISGCSHLDGPSAGINYQDRQDPIDFCPANSRKLADKRHRCQQSLNDLDAFCCVCGSSKKDDANSLLECSNCLIIVHQACYGIKTVPKGRWSCRPCRRNSTNIACVLCGYEGGAMTRAVRNRSIVKSLLKTWKDETGYKPLKPARLLADSDVPSKPFSEGDHDIVIKKIPKTFQVHNSVTAGARDPTITQWVHVVCGLWTPGTRCPNVATMSAFDVSGVLVSTRRMVCSICNRPGGSSIKCRVMDCSVYFHPWCAHQKGLLQSETEGIDNESVGFYGRCLLHAMHYNYHPDGIPMDAGMESPSVKEFSCARTESYKGREREHRFIGALRKPPNDSGRCNVPQEQLNAWLHINGQKSCQRNPQKPVSTETEYDCRKEYARYRKVKGWKQLVVYKSRIHALGLYTSQFIPRGAMVVEYVGEIVGLRVADKREIEYQSGKKLQYKSACYFFRIDKESIIDATRKGGIARFVNHSCLPNCVAKVITVRNEKKVVFFAERDIKSGEEITYDYHFNHEEEGKKIPCFCSSKNCRRYLN
ncbi:unnamed protein product [Spirodela intermedia]|uniref:Uncharacterized protein n=1 Tax=Spirodela intermedia TaxID=51605 RepID=A0A7I8LFM8_SPIIN|nr:unnamed protein product [Spirodela intermedia]